MRKILDILKCKFGWQTYKDAFFCVFVSIWLFVDVVVATCIWDIDPLDRRFTLYMINFGFIGFIAICTFIKCRGGKFNDWLNTKFETQDVNVKIDMEIKTDAVSLPGPYLYWIDDDGEWLGTTPYKENITEEEAEQIKAELRKKRNKQNNV